MSNHHLVLYPASILKVEQEIITPTSEKRQPEMFIGKQLFSGCTSKIQQNYAKLNFLKNIVTRQSYKKLYNHDHPEPVPSKSSSV